MNVTVPAGGMKKLRKQADSAASLLGAMANSRRLLVLCSLSQNELSVGELAETAGISIAAVSQHLSKMRALGIVRTRREAQTIYYRLDSDEARLIIEALYSAFCGPRGRSRKK